MAENPQVQMQATLGLTGLTMNAMALIAPGAFLWLTYLVQATEGATAPAMWAGIVLALLLCLATAVCYAEMAKLYPGAGSSYYFAEQAFLNHDKAWRFARLSKFIVGWASHLYYWIYPGVMVATMGVICGYLAGSLWPNFMSASNPGPMFMIAVAVVFSFFIAYIAQRGVNGSTSINIAVNVIQISALVLFSVLALGYRFQHAPGSTGLQFDSVTSSTYSYQFKTNPDGSIARDASNVPVALTDASGKPVPYVVSYPTHDAQGNFMTHSKPSSVVAPHKLGWVFVQATVAILILVGFESVTAMGGEAKNPKRDVPIAVILSLLVQGMICYLFEYFAANYFLNSGYSLQNATGSAAPVGDMMIVVGDWLLGPGRGRYFMLLEAATVFLALIGTTLSCMNTAARVTYAMGKDEEVPSHFGLLHERKLTPHRAIWTLACISAVVGSIGVLSLFGDASAPSDATIAALPHGFWSSFGYPSHDVLAGMPNSLLTITLASNFGTFLLYGLSCVTCLVCFNKHPQFNFFKHFLIPVFGLAANLGCMAFYLVGPFMGYGTKKEPLFALGIAFVWGVYGAVYFWRNSKRLGRTTLHPVNPKSAVEV